MDNNKEVSIIVKWSGKEYPMTDLTEQDTVAVLKHEIFKATHVRPERQKLLNLRHKGKKQHRPLLYVNIYRILTNLRFLFGSCRQTS